MKHLLLCTAAAFVLLCSSCKKDDCTGNSACCLEPDAGFCFAAIPKYYFDHDAGECREFIWGGCEGTVPFDTLEECEMCDCGGN